MRTALIGALGVAAALWLANTSHFVDPPSGQVPRLVAHRGIHQTADRASSSPSTCAASRIRPPQHGFIENTVPAMRAAFDAGADVVELDVQLTPSGDFAVFRDMRLECRTDGSGEARKQPMAYLRSLDMGHGYTADGATFPLRGQGIGLMPTLRDVLDAGLPGLLLIDFKTREPGDGAALARLLEAPEARGQIFGVTGGDLPVRTAMARVPGLRGFDGPALRACLTRYALIGWSGRVPAKCRDRLIAVSLDRAPWLWGWPHRFVDRMRAAGSDVILMGPRDGSGLASGIDDADMLARVPAGYDGWLWTNRIEVIGPLLHGD